MYTTTTRNGYRQYKSDSKDCKDCPLRNKCTKSKNMTKVIERHLWEEFREYADEIRHTMEWKEIYPQRKKSSKSSIYPSKYTKKDNFILKIAYIQ